MIKSIAVFNGKPGDRSLTSFVTHAFIYLMLYTTLSSPAYAEDTRIKVSLLSGGVEDSQFWNSMTRFAQAVAEDLNIELTIQYPPEHAPNAMKKSSHKVLEEMDSGSYLIAPYIGSITSDLLKIADDRGIKTFIINVDILEKEKTSVGQPRGKYKNWIAHSYADDVQAGYLAANELLRQLPKKPTGNGMAAIRMVGLIGPFTDQASFNRKHGLKKRISESKNTMLYEIQEARFQETPAKETTAKFLDKYPSLNAIWTASDDMAIGAIAALKSAGKNPGQDVLVTGIDWTQRGLQSVKSGELAATTGGHFIEAGIALILIYDYHHNIDFADELGTTIKTPMVAISKRNIHEYLGTIGTNPDWSKIDFKMFAKTHKKNLDKYDFSWKKIMSAMQQPLTTQ